MTESVIISVSNKSRLEELLDGLFKVNPDVKIFSSGGTAKRIREIGYETVNISSYTKFPESPKGLVKTLHPKVHGGILLDKDKDVEKDYLKKNKIKNFGLVVCNLYPFEKSVKSKAGEKEIIENIDIGGPTLIRSAAKGALRHGKVAPVIDPEDYSYVINNLLNNGGKLKKEVLYLLAHKGFEHTCQYDQKIRTWTENKLKGDHAGSSKRNNSKS